MTPEQAADVVVAALPSQQLVLVAIDGPSAAGTSTLADVLARRLRAAVVHGDDFYRDTPAKAREQLDGETGYAQFFDWQRMRREALEPLRRGRTARYLPFDWHAGVGLSSRPVVVEPAPVLIVEGVYSARPEFSDLLDLTVLVATPPEERLRRLVARGHGNDEWWPRWHAAEDHYYSEIRPPQAFDIVVAGA